MRSNLESLAKDWWWQPLGRQAHQIWVNWSQILRWFQIYTKPNMDRWGPNTALISYKWDHRSSIISLIVNLYTDLSAGKDLTQRKHKDLQPRLESHFFANLTFYGGLASYKLMYLVFYEKAEEAYRWDIRWLTHIDSVHHVDQPLSLNLAKSTFEFHKE